MSELTLCLCVGDARAAIASYTEGPGAVVTFEPNVMYDGRIGPVAHDFALDQGFDVGVGRER